MVVELLVREVCDRFLSRVVICCEIEVLAALRSFPQNALGDGPALWIFLQYSRIRVIAQNALKLRSQCI